MPIEIYTEEEGVTFEGGRDPETEEDLHLYRLNGKKVPSVSQVLKSCGMVDYRHVKKETLDFKSAIGIKVHQYTLWDDMGELDEEAEETLKEYPVYYNRLMGWREFCSDFEFLPNSDHSEKKMIVRINGMLYAMTPDRHGYSMEGSTVVDIKSSTVILPGYDLQTAAYSIPFKSEQSPIPKRAIVQLLEKPVNNRYYRVKWPDDRNDERTFLGCLNACWWKINQGVSL